MTRRAPAGVALFLVLCVASFATAAVVLRAKTAKLAVEFQRLDCSITPGAPGHHVAHIRFFSRYSDPHAHITIVGQGLTPARTLAADVPVVANRPVRLRWNGSTDGGPRAPAGVYALRINLPDRGRSILWTAQRIRVGGACPR